MEQDLLPKNLSLRLIEVYSNTHTHARARTTKRKIIYKYLNINIQKHINAFALYSKYSNSEEICFLTYNLSV